MEKFLTHSDNICQIAQLVATSSTDANSKLYLYTVGPGKFQFALLGLMTKEMKTNHPIANILA